jgi:glyoxylase-like metal-dependent hydrolase (beta-lactamase superfamily II)
MDTHFTQLRPDLTIHQSEIFHTNTGILKTAEGYVLVDPAFTQADFERIAAFTQPHPILAGFSTHAHYDHLFWSSLFGDETPRYCSEGTLEQVSQNRQEILNEALGLENGLFNLNSQLLVVHLAHILVLTAGLHYLQNISVEVVDIPGHLSGQTAFLFLEYGVLFAADTLSNTELPSIEGSRQSLLDYLESLNTLEGLIKRADWIVPGHGDLVNPAEAKKRLDMDRRYLQALLALRAEDFAASSEALAKVFLEQNQETRAKTPDAWQIHLQNMDFARQWL